MAKKLGEQQSPVAARWFGVPCMRLHAAQKHLISSDQSPESRFSRRFAWPNQDTVTITTIMTIQVIRTGMVTVKTIMTIPTTIVKQVGAAFSSRCS